MNKNSMESIYKNKKVGFRKTALLNEQKINNQLSNILGNEYDNYRLLWDKTSNGKTELKYPLHLDIELNPSCNLKCKMCTYSAEVNKKTSKKYWMIFEDYKKIIDEAVDIGVKSIQFNHINEPLMRRDIGGFIKYAKDCGIVDIMISTNGVLLTEKMIKELIESGLTRLSISIDAITVDVYNKMRKGGDYNKLVSNIENFIDTKNKMDTSLPLLKVTFVRSPLNEHEQRDFVDYWNKKADIIVIQNINNPYDEDVGNKNEVNEYFGLKRKKIGSVDKICPHPFQRMVIKSDGVALLCCNLRGVNLEIGNVINNGVYDTYNGKIAKGYRKLHSSGEYYKIDTCKKCIEYSSFQDI